MLSLSGRPRRRCMHLLDGAVAGVRSACPLGMDKCYDPEERPEDGRPTSPLRMSFSEFLCASRAFFPLSRAWTSHTSLPLDDHFRTFCTHQAFQADLTSEVHNVYRTGIHGCHERSNQAHCCTPPLPHNGLRDQTFCRTYQGLLAHQDEPSFQSYYTRRACKG